MTTLTHDEFQNLLLSEDDDIFDAAVSMLPAEDHLEFLEARKKYRHLQEEFMDRLESECNSLVVLYLNLEEAASEKSALIAGAMYLKGVLEDHVDLRITGWTAPGRERLEEDPDDTIVKN